MKKIIHPVAGLMALLTIATLWLSTTIAEIFAIQTAIITIKTAIPWGLLLLIPALMLAGSTGFALARGHRSGLADQKTRRMRWIAANGILVLIPAALFLASRASAETFDHAFWIVQALELIAGATNITLLCLNMRDGLRMKARAPRALPNHDPA